MVACTFCKIIANKLPSYKIYEDEHTLCFLTINPISKGHCLIIPKSHSKDISSMTEESMRSIGVAAKNVSNLLKKKLKSDGFNILHASGKAAQQSVFHFHLHLVPRYNKDKLDAWPKSSYKEKSLESTHQKITK